MPINKGVIMKIAVAMSGGVDSTVTVVLLKQQGYDIVGITLDMIGDGKVFEEAKALAKKMDIEHHCIDVSEIFGQQIIDYFVNSYKEGLTPSPCVLCNRYIKFGLLADKARELGCEKMATGHYVIKKDGDLYVAADKNKDQTYFLFDITQEQIDFCEFPLGGYTKPEVVKIAEEYGVKPKGGESQDICFVSNGKYAEFIEDKIGKLPEAELIDKDKKVLKKHKSIINYTIGQRKGLDIGGLSEPKYVVKIDAENNSVVVGNIEELAQTRVYLKDINWLGDSVNHSPLEGESKSLCDFGGGAIQLLVKLRYKQKIKKATLHLDESYIDLEEADYSVAPGQAAVFYNEEGRLLGGGFITDKKEA